MRDYGVVSPKFWIGETGKSLRGDPHAQIVALYLMTCPHANMIGVFHCPLVYIAHETGIPFEGASKALQRLSEGGFCTYDEASETVFVHKMAAFQVGESLLAGDNRVKAVIKEWKNIAQPIIRQAFYAIYSVAFHLPTEEENGRGSEAPSKPLRSQEQDQEQEQDIGAPAKRSPSGSRLPEDWTLPADWQQWAEGERPDLDVGTVACTFRDFWVAKAGKDGRKADWQATWRNWVRNQRVGPINGAKPAATAWAGAR